MLTFSKLLGYVELKVGSLDVEVPIRTRGEPAPDGTPLAMFEMKGDAYAIMVTEESRSQTMSAAVEHAAEDALRHLSRKLLN
ncbi:MAG: hypothetical protein U0414_32770 [Polyangiaceae bacterium]